MKKYIIIDDNKLTGYASIISSGNIFKVYINIKERLNIPYGFVYKIYLKNSVNSYYLGIPEYCGNGLQLKKEFPSSYFKDFLEDMPSKIKFEIDIQESDIKVTDDNIDLKIQNNDKIIKKRLSKYHQVFDIFEGEYKETSWYRVHDVDIVFDTDFTKKVMNNISVIKSINILKHYLVGITKDKKILYAIPSRFGIDPDPMNDKGISTKWVPISGQGYKFGNFGYFIISENKFDKAEYFAKYVE